MAKAVPVAERSALAAIRADSEDAWAHFALASVYLFNRRFRKDSVAEFELALRLNPNFSPARGILAWRCSIAALAGRLAAAQQALRFSPRDPFAAIYCGVAAYCQYIGRNYDEAIRLSREALRHRSDFSGAHRVTRRRSA